jgi:tRNA(Phe) wybutosine-synthesizing methylase Tyw3
MTPDAVAQVAEALIRVRSGITPEEHQRLTAEIEVLRRMQQSVLADREMLLDDAANLDAREQLALRVASFYQRLGMLEEAVERLRQRAIR